MKWSYKTKTRRRVKVRQADQKDEINFIVDFVFFDWKRSPFVLPSFCTKNFLIEPPGRSSTVEPSRTFQEVFRNQRAWVKKFGLDDSVHRFSSNSSPYFRFSCFSALQYHSCNSLGNSVTPCPVTVITSLLNSSRPTHLGRYEMFKAFKLWTSKWSPPTGRNMLISVWQVMAVG